MPEVSLPQIPIQIEYIPWSWTEANTSTSQDPFSHEARINSHNHHNLHPWGPEVKVGSDKFNALYAQENNQFMYHVWYSEALAPFMATEVLCIHHFSTEMAKVLERVLRMTIKSGVSVALASSEGRDLTSHFQTVLDGLGLTRQDKLFVRFGATSAKDSWGTLAGLPTMKPPPLSPNASQILHWLLTSSRVAGRLLALSENFWTADPGEALVIERWSPALEARQEYRVFCNRGRVTAVCQNIWWEELENDQKYSTGFLDAILDLWKSVQPHISFDSCIMDIVMTHSEQTWTAKIVEFNSFGAHLNTGSNLFHWVHDAEILEGKTNHITVRFVDWTRSNLELRSEWDFTAKIAETTGETSESSTTVLSETENGENVNEEAPIMKEFAKPDWLALEEKLRSKFANGGINSTGLRLQLSDRITIPLRGNWSSAF